VLDWFHSTNPWWGVSSWKKSMGGEEGATKVGGGATVGGGAGKSGTGGVRGSGVGPQKKRRGRICVFYGRGAGCRNGDECPFLHVDRPKKVGAKPQKPPNTADGSLEKALEQGDETGGAVVKEGNRKSEVGEKLDAGNVKEEDDEADPVVSMDVPPPGVDPKSWAKMPAAVKLTILNKNGFTPSASGYKVVKKKSSKESESKPQRVGVASQSVKARKGPAVKKGAPEKGPTAKKLDPAAGPEATTSNTKPAPVTEPAAHAVAKASSAASPVKAIEPPPGIAREQWVLMPQAVKERILAGDFKRGKTSTTPSSNNGELAGNSKPPPSNTMASNKKAPPVLEGAEVKVEPSSTKKAPDAAQKRVTARRSLFEKEPEPESTQQKKEARTGSTKQETSSKAQPPKIKKKCQQENEQGFSAAAMSDEPPPGIEKMIWMLMSNELREKVAQEVTSARNGHPAVESEGIVNGEEGNSPETTYPEFNPLNGPFRPDARMLCQIPCKSHDDVFFAADPLRDEIAICVLGAKSNKVNIYSTKDGKFLLSGQLPATAGPVAYDTDGSMWVFLLKKGQIVKMNRTGSKLEVENTQDPIEVSAEMSSCVQEMQRREGKFLLRLDREKVGAYGFPGWVLVTESGPEPLPATFANPIFQNIEFLPRSDDALLATDNQLFLQRKDAVCKEIVYTNELPNRLLLGVTAERDIFAVGCWDYLKQFKAYVISDGPRIGDGGAGLMSKISGFPEGLQGVEKICVGFQRRIFLLANEKNRSINSKQSKVLRKLYCIEVHRDLQNLAFSEISELIETQPAVPKLMPAPEKPLSVMKPLSSSTNAFGTFNYYGGAKVEMTALAILPERITVEIILLPHLNQPYLII